MIRATVLRALVLAAAFAVGLTPVTCLGENSNPLPTKATKELPPELLSLLRQKKMPKYSPIVVRVFKEEAELEVWKQDTTGHFQILKTYPICRWSGDLGPKLHEGDRQAPEGFYTVTPAQMNPNSNYYLAINTGFPNIFDKANDRHGGFLMIHGKEALVIASVGRQNRLITQKNGEETKSWNVAADDHDTNGERSGKNQSDGSPQCGPKNGSEQDRHGGESGISAVQKGLDDI